MWRKLFLVLFFCMCQLQIHQVSAAVEGATTLYGDFGGFWQTGDPDVSGNNNVLGFEVSGQVYSTEVDDSILDANSISYYTGANKPKYVAFPFTHDIFPSTGGGYYLIGVPPVWNVANPIPNPIFTDPRSFYVTDGKQGLEMSTSVFNIPTTELRVENQIIDGALGFDSIPDILVTQVGAPPSSPTSFWFESSTGAVVGNVLNVNLSGLPVVALNDYVFRSAISGGSSIVSSKRNMRMVSFLASDFGIQNTDSTASNYYANVDAFVMRTNNSADISFIAYDKRVFAVNQVDLGLTATGSITDCAANEAELIFSVTNHSPVNIPVGTPVELSIPAGVNLFSPQISTNSGSSVGVSRYEEGVWMIPELKPNETARLILTSTGHTVSSVFSGAIQVDDMLNAENGVQPNTAAFDMSTLGDDDGDGIFNTCDTNSSPTALSDSGSTIIDTAVDIDILANDSDSDGLIQSGSVVITQLPSNGTLSVHPTTGVVTYTPNSAFVGTDTFRYTVQDDAGDISNEAMVNISVSSNSHPTLTATGTQIMQGEVLNLQTLVISATDNEDGALTGSVLVSDDGGFDSNISGVYTVEFSVTDSDGNTTRQSVTVEVNARNIVATNDVLSIKKGDDGNINLFSNDIFSGSTAEQSDVDISLTGGVLTGVTLAPTGIFTVPASFPKGRYTQEYQICEKAYPANCATASIDIVVRSSGGSGGGSIPVITVNPNVTAGGVRNHEQSGEAPKNDEGEKEESSEKTHISNENSRNTSSEKDGVSLVERTSPNGQKYTVRTFSCPIIDAINDHDYPYKKSEVFLDEDTAKYRDTILKFAEIGVVDGYEDGNFLPKKMVSRVEFTKMALISHCYVYKNENTDDIKNLYTDMIPDTWQARVVKKADELGIISGYHDGEFKPDDFITRAEATKILMRIAFLQANTPVSMSYGDISVDWHEKYIRIGETLELFQAEREGFAFRPDQGVSREIMVKLIEDLVDLYQ